MTACSNCKSENLMQREHSWFCFGCGSVGLGQQPKDLLERPCTTCGTKTFHDLCYKCWKEGANNVRS